MEIDDGETSLLGVSSYSRTDDFVIDSRSPLVPNLSAVFLV